MFFRRFFLVMDRVVWWWIELYDDESSYNRVLWWIELYDDEIEMSMCDSGMIWLDMWWWIGDELVINWVVWWGIYEVCFLFLIWIWASKAWGMWDGEWDGDGGRRCSFFVLWKSL
jgi:hypothetical protein